MADPEAVEQLVHLHGVSGAEAHVAEHVEVGKERVLLEEVADPTVLRSDVDPPLGVEQHGAVERHETAHGVKQAGDHAKHSRLAGAGGPDQRERLARLDGQVC